MTLEDRLIDDMKRGIEVDLERALLIVSGIKTEEEVDEYVAKLDVLEWKFEDYLHRKENSLLGKISSFLEEGIFGPKSTEHKKANVLHKFLWKKKRKRYKEGFEGLDEVINSQLSNKKPIGNCLSLTSLYSVLALRADLDVSILLSKNHILSRVLFEYPNYVNCENTEKDGFNDKVWRTRFKEKDKKDLIILTIDANLSLGFKEKKSIIETYDEMIKINPGLEILYHNRGVFKICNRDFKGAIRDFNKHIILRPGCEKAHYNLAKAKIRMGDLSEATKECNKSLRINHRDASSYQQLGLIKERLGDYQGAIKCFSYAIKFEEKKATHYSDRAEMKIKIGDFKGAKKDLKKSLKLGQVNPSAYLNLGVLNIKEGNLEKAEEYATKAINQSKDWANPHITLGNVFYIQGRLKDAKEEYKKAIDKDPHYVHDYVKQFQNIEDIEMAVKEDFLAAELQPVCDELILLVNKAKKKADFKDHKSSDYQP
jgi:tetratricopeptide (TPR) repeat protein